jgi:hypothetical protein
MWQECGNNKAQICDLGGVAQGSQMPRATSHIYPKFSCSTFVRKCDPRATPVRPPCDPLATPTEIDYSFTLTTLIEDLGFCATPISNFLSATQKNKYCIYRCRKVELWQNYGKET